MRGLMEKDENPKAMDIAEYRSSIYGLLAAIYRSEVTSDFLAQVKDPQFLGVLANLGLGLNGDFIEKPEDELLNDLAIEYARLFLGPGKHISPHESVHHQRNDGQWGQLWGESTVEVKKFIEATGLSYDSNFKGIPDHISVEFEFMETLTCREAIAFSEKDETAAQRCMDVQRKFIKEHLIRWIPSFCEKVIKEAELPFYRAFAELTYRFIKLEMQELNLNGSKFNESV